MDATTEPETARKRGFFATWLDVCTRPRRFFGGAGEFPSRVPASIFYGVVQGMRILGEGLVLAWENGFDGRAWGIAGGGVLVMVADAIVMLFFVSGLLWVCARWAGSTVTFGRVRDTYAFAAAPLVLLPIPYLGWAFAIYWIVVVAVAFATVTAISKGRAMLALGFALVTPVLAAVIPALLLRFFVIEAFMIPSGSMYPTFVPGDHVFALKRVYGFTSKRAPSRGDPVVYERPDGSGASANFAHRVVAVSGDLVAARGNELFINGWRVPHCSLGSVRGPERPDQELELFVEFLGDGAYLVAYDVGYDHPGEWKVPPGQVFIMGDNRNNAADSRTWFGGRGGGLPPENVVGRIDYQWWPRWRNVSEPVAPPDLAASLSGKISSCLTKRPARPVSPPAP